MSILFLDGYQRHGISDRKESVPGLPGLFHLFLLSCTPLLHTQCVTKNIIINDDVAVAVLLIVIPHFNALARTCLDSFTRVLVRR